jgi:hypothetical protein
VWRPALVRAARQGGLEVKRSRHQEDRTARFGSPVWHGHYGRSLQ